MQRSVTALLVPLTSGLLLAALVWLGSGPGPGAEPGACRWDGDAVAVYAVALPGLKDFGHYYDGGRDPFMPSAELRQEDGPTIDDQCCSGDDESSTYTPPRPEPAAAGDVFQQPASLVFKQDLPIYRGCLQVGGRAVALLQIGDRAVQLQPGQSYHHWQLDRIDAGGARIVDPHGLTWDLPLGRER